MSATESNQSGDNEADLFTSTLINNANELKSNGKDNSIENCQHKVVYMDKEEADTIVKEIRTECTKHEECSDCAFNEFCETL